MVDEHQLEAATVWERSNIMANGPISGEFTTLRETKHGLLAYNHNDCVIGLSLTTYGEWSETELSGCLLQIIKPGSMVLDVGAHIGTHTLAFAKAVGPAGHVVAFEPQRWAHSYLCANVVLNSLDNVTTMRAAVGGECGKRQIPGVNPREPQNFGAVDLRRDDIGEAVDCVTIDSLDLKGCNLIKIDVEGMEFDVLDGAADTIQRYHPVLFVEHKKADPGVIAWIKNRGYQLYWFASPFYRVGNYYGATEDLRPGRGDVSILAVPVGSSITGVPEVLDENDTWDKARLRPV